MTDGTKPDPQTWLREMAAREDDAGGFPATTGSPRLTRRRCSIPQMQQRRCTSPGHGDLTYIGKHDAFACLLCDVWTEHACDDPRCGYCAGRPERPSLMSSGATNGSPIP